MQGPDTKFVMVWYDTTDVAASHDDVTAPLAHDMKAEPLQGSHAFLGADNG